MSHALLPTDNLNEWLVRHPEWRMENDKLYRVFRFPDFQAAFAWMTEVAAFAEEVNHHPEWFNVYARVEVMLTTHDAGGVTTLDVKMAERMERLLQG